MKFIIIFLFLAYNSLAQNFIDLGNLEIEGELRRPAINLFTNTEVVKENLFQFAKEQIEVDTNSYNFEGISSEIKQFNNFEASLLEI